MCSSSPTRSASPPPSRDTTAPAVIAAGAASGAWYSSARLVTLSASDEPGGSGAASITYTLDGVETTVPGATALVNVPALPNAAHSLTFCATDCAGNACGEQTLSFTIDSAGPVTAAKRDQRSQGYAIALRYKVGDNLSPKATAIRIVVKNGGGTRREDHPPHDQEHRHLVQRRVDSQGEGHLPLLRLRQGPRWEPAGQDRFGEGGRALIATQPA